MARYEIPIIYIYIYDKYMFFHTHMTLRYILLRIFYIRGSFLLLWIYSKTSSGLYWVAPAFALLHVVRRQGEINFFIPKRT